MNRLHPNKNSGRYYVLTNLKRAFTLLIDKYIENDDNILIDFGCGDMPYKELFNNKVSNYYGADIKKNINSTIEIVDNQLKVDNDFADIVFSSQVLEHVRDVDKYLNEAIRVLKKNAYLILSTHGIWRYHPDPNDYWRWTKEGLVEVFSIHENLEILEIISVMGEVSTGLQLFQDGFKNRIPKFFHGIYFRLINFLQNLLDKKDIHSNNASVFIILAKKR